MQTTLARLLSLVFVGFTTAASAQTSAGGHFSALASEYPRDTRSGIGGFFTYTPGPLGLDLSATYFVQGEIGGNAWQLLAGPRFGVARGKVGVYGRVRPGVIRFSERFFKREIVCVAIFPIPDACLVERTNLALDLGVTVEAFPSSRSVLRFDAGDTMTRYDAARGTQWTHGFQFVVGAGWRF